MRCVGNGEGHMLRSSYYSHHALHQRRVVRILVVEPYEKDEHFEHSLKAVFEHLSYHNIYYLTTVRKLRSALESIQQNEYHAVIMDIGLADSASLDELSAIHERIPGVPIIVFSGRDDTGVRVQAFDQGARYLMVKGKDNTADLKAVVSDIFM
jgi:DNA-binding response OmpR family regulator